MTDTTPTTSEYDDDDADQQERKAYQEKPSFSTKLVNQTVTQGSDIRLKIFVTGKPEPEIEWQVLPESSYASKR